jgi:hypothetical protein
VTPAAFLARVARRATQLRLASALFDGGAEIDDAEASRIAVQEIAAEMRQRPNSVRSFVADTADLTVTNVRQFLLDKLSDMARRLSSAPLPQPFGRSTPTPRPMSLRVRPLSKRSPKVEKALAEPTASYVGAYSGGGNSAQLIPDAEFHTSVHSIPTQNWRKSIEANERKRGRYVG